MTPRIGSLCTGYGGLDLALIAAMGGEVVWHVENAADPSLVLAERFPGVPNHHDVKTTDWTGVEPIDWLTAGYPCQPFSDAGLRLGEADERHLWPYVADAIRVLRPGNVLLENVRGHLKRGFGTVLGDLAAIGYDARWVCLRASDAGAPHLRARVFIVATDTGRERHGSRQDGRSVGRVDREDAGEALERERSRGVAVDRSDAPAQDADLATGRERRLAAPGQAPRRRPRPDPCGRGRAPTPDADRGRREGRQERDSEPNGPALDSASRDDAERLDEVAWGVYEPAIRRWERVTGRRAPRPVEPAPRGGERVSCRFVEWLMGVPEGWVTDVLPHNPALVALGNGVVPQQGYLALSVLGHRLEAAA